MRFVVLSIILIFFAVLSVPTLSSAKDRCSGDCASCHNLTLKEAGEITAPLGVKVKAVALAPIRGLFELLAERDGKEGLVYVDFSKKHLMQGVIIKADDLKSGQRKILEKSDVLRLMKVHSVVMGNPKAAKEIFVLTDPDCPFCRQFHVELQKLVAEVDVAVYVKPYPLEIHPEAYKKAQSILESGSLELLNKAFSGGEIPPPKDPTNKEAVEEIIGLAKSLGINGTPAILLPNGKKEVGFRSAAEIKRMLDEK